ncbi:MAG: dienelactone hydrolase family protein [Phycisphaerales bacterium]|jgi:dienelactone hydrolase|nr:dienelactone hydrolase family protein [Phycisphaerales bacterium]
METRDLAYEAYRDLLVGSGEDAVVVVPDYHGVTPYARALAEGFASNSGRLGVVLDLYGDQGMPATGAEAFSAINPMMTDRQLGLKRLQACVDQLHGQGVKRITLIGYSCGGTMVYDAARTGMDIDGVIGVFGLFDPLDNRPLVMRSVPDRKVPLLALVGGEDDLVTRENYQPFIRELTAFGIDWQLHVFGGAKHAYTLRQEDNLEVQSGEEPALQLFNESANRRTERLIDQFLGEIFS